MLSHLAVVCFGCFTNGFVILNHQKWNIWRNQLEQNTALVEQYYLSYIFFWPPALKTLNLVCGFYMTRLYQCMNFSTVFCNKETYKFLIDFCFYEIEFLCVPLLIQNQNHFCTWPLPNHVNILFDNNWGGLKSWSDFFSMQNISLLPILQKKEIVNPLSFFKPVENRWMKLNQRCHSILTLVIDNMTVIIP